MAKPIIQGLGDLRKAFDGLNSDLQKKIAPRLVASAGGVMRKQAKVNAQSAGLKRSGALIRNIAIKRERKAPPGVTQYNLGVRHGRDLGRRAKKFLVKNTKGRVVTKYENDPFYWHFHEFGTSRGHKRIEYITKAAESKRSEAIAAMSQKLQKEIEKANRRTR